MEKVEAVEKIEGEVKRGKYEPNIIDREVDDVEDQSTSDEMIIGDYKETTTEEESDGLVEIVLERPIKRYYQNNNSSDQKVNNRNSMADEIEKNNEKEKFVKFSDDNNMNDKDDFENNRSSIINTDKKEEIIQRPIRNGVNVDLAEEEQEADIFEEPKVVVQRYHETRKRFHVFLSEDARDRDICDSWYFDTEMDLEFFYAFTSNAIKNH